MYDLNLLGYNTREQINTRARISAPREATEVDIDSSTSTTSQHTYRALTTCIKDFFRVDSSGLLFYIRVLNGKWSNRLYFIQRFSSHVDHSELFTGKSHSHTHTALLFTALLSSSIYLSYTFKHCRKKSPQRPFRG